MPIHVQSVELQAASIIEGHVAADAIKGLTRGDERCRTIRRGSQQSLHRASIKIVGAKVDIGMIVRAGRSRGLNGVAAFFITLQVEAILEACINVLEVGIGGDANTSEVAACSLGDIGAAGILALCHAAGVLIADGNGIVVAAGMQAAAELYSFSCSGKGKRVVYELLQRKQRVHRPDVRLRVNIVRADPDASRLGEWKLQLELSDAQVQRVFRQLHKAPDVDELQVAVA